ncbi:hypothetical protein ILUMI_10784 [Ignelater luminosus]|uniref:N-acetyltransferase domain-containing protein n=1 Tax=Ignelater luminosus TaxID=2038154 RepID=A0A8K0CXG6_IGNLU|nr:hypothetical protein ILUMI_10784 [Ignelater luminosus]
MWVRPVSALYPTTWAKFTRTNKDGKLIHFEIQDITEDLYSACTKFMTKHFIPDEPMYTALGFMNDSASIKEQQGWWTAILPEKLSLVCLIKDSKNPNTESQIAGINFLYYHHKSHDEMNCQFKGEVFKTICNIVQQLENQINRYELLNVDEYIDDFGLCVHPDYRGMGIATELLKAKDNLGKGVGLKATFTVFSAIASQKAADKAGYKTLVEMKYSDLQKIFPQHELNVKDTPSIKYTYKLFSDT